MSAIRQPYSRFQLVEETATDGWRFGAISEFLPHDGKPVMEGDGFVEAPDGSRAGLDWCYTGEPIKIVSQPDETTWGVYEVRFPKPIYNLADLVGCFRSVLPLVQSQYQNSKRQA